MWAFQNYDVQILLHIKLQDCGLNCHEKCRDQVPKACTKYKAVPRDTTSENLDADARAAAGHHPANGSDYFNSFSRGREATTESSNIIYQVRISFSA